MTYQAPELVELGMAEQLVLGGVGDVLDGIGPEPLSAEEN
jgi:hypothetical protein